MSAKISHIWARLDGFEQRCEGIMHDLRGGLGAAATARQSPSMAGDVFKMAVLNLFAIDASQGPSDLRSFDAPSLLCQHLGRITALQRS